MGALFVCVGGGMDGNWNRISFNDVVPKECVVGPGIILPRKITKHDIVLENTGYRAFIFLFSF